jgi:hypothetical protein
LRDGKDKKIEMRANKKHCEPLWCAMQEGRCLKMVRECLAIDLHQ